MSNDDTIPQQLTRQVGGSFQLTALLQKRVRELVRGDRPVQASSGGIRGRDG